MVRLAAAAVAVALAACGDAPPPAVPAGDVRGAPIAGAPIDGSDVARPELAVGDTAAPVSPLVSNGDGPGTGAVRGDTPSTDGIAPRASDLPAPGPAAGVTPAAPDAAAAPDAPPGPAVPPIAAAEPAVGADAAAPGAADAKAAEPAPRKEGASLLPAGHKKGTPLVLTWEQLASFEYVPPPPAYPDPNTGQVPDMTAENEKAKRQIPAEIWELEGETLTVEGYMLPLEYADEGVKSFIVSRHAMGCCFGVMPRPHEMIECDMGEGKSTPYIGYVPIVVTAVVHVGLKDGPQTALSPIYRMDAPKIAMVEEK